MWVLQITAPARPPITRALRRARCPAARSRSPSIWASAAARAASTRATSPKATSASTARTGADNILRGGENVLAPPQPARERDGGKGAGELREDENWRAGRRDPGVGVRERTRDGHRRIGEGGGGGEPIGRGDVETDRVGNGRWRARDAAQDGHHQAEGRNTFRQPLAGAATRRFGDLPHEQSEHQMRDPHAYDGS